MKVTVEGTPKEITDFVLELQSQQTDIEYCNQFYVIPNELEKSLIVTSKNDNATLKLNKVESLTLAKVIKDSVQMW